VRRVHVVVPDWIDDPARPSGGNTYDRQIIRGLSALGWSVHEHRVATFEDAVSEIPDDAVVLVDGLIASVPPSRPLRLVVLIHMPRGDDRERALVEAAAGVITTSEWSRRALGAERVHVATPGVEPHELAPGTATGAALLCVGAVTFVKGHDVLLEALRTIADLSWRCECVGSLDREPAFVAGLRPDDRVRFTGPRTDADLERSYAAADLLVLPSRTEAYGMVITEALARGLPVVASDVGGVREALGGAAGLLVTPDDPAALGTALRSWLADPGLREQLRRAARDRRAALPGWEAATAAIAAVLSEVSR
jgi:glycosyltransferase involved in cell wall biosynthesis